MPHAVYDAPLVLPGGLPLLMAFIPIGCVVGNEVLATQLWPTGVKNLGPIALPDKFRGGLVLVDVSQVVDLSAIFSFAMEMSFDGGANFTPLFSVGLSLPDSGYSLIGGVLADGAGVPVRVYGSSFKFPQPGSVTRQIRGQLSLSAPAILGMTVVAY